MGRGGGAARLGRGRVKVPVWKPVLGVSLVCGLWLVACGLWLVALWLVALWLVACGLWLVACGLWLVACGLWLVACGCGLWLVACGLWLVCVCVFSARQAPTEMLQLIAKSLLLVKFRSPFRCCLQASKYVSPHPHLHTPLMHLVLPSPFHPHPHPHC